MDFSKSPKIKLFYFLIFLLLVLFKGQDVFAYSKASLYFGPSRGTFYVGSVFDVSVFVDTGGNNINAIKASIKFDPRKLQVASPTASRSFIEIWVAQPTYDNAKGEIKFVGGVPDPGIKTSSGLVSTISFRAIAPGETTVYLQEESMVLLNDAQGTNILNSLGRGSFSLILPPPEGPKIFSPTHPDINNYYSNNNPVFCWDNNEDLSEFSYLLSKESNAVPDNSSNGVNDCVSFSDLQDGVWYFHLKGKKEGIWGGTSHFPVFIDTQPPAVFSLQVEPNKKTITKQPFVFFITTDSFSGISHYELKYLNITEGKKSEGAEFFVEAVSPFRLPILETGKYLLIVRAYDLAGNWRESSVEIEILPSNVLFSKKGIQYKSVFIYWWILILLVIMGVFLILIFLAKKYKKLKNNRKMNL